MSLFDGRSRIQRRFRRRSQIAGIEWLEDRRLLANYVVTNTLDSGAGSLRNAIDAANTNPGHDSIHFDIQSALPHIISPLTPLPNLLDSVTIDGTTEPDYGGYAGR